MLDKCDAEFVPAMFMKCHLTKLEKKMFMTW